MWVLEFITILDVTEPEVFTPGAVFVAVKAVWCNHTLCLDDYDAQNLRFLVSLCYFEERTSESA